MSGAEDDPVGSLEAAKEVVRANAPEVPVEIHIHPGDYFQQYLVLVL